MQLPKRCLNPVPRGLVLKRCKDDPNPPVEVTVMLPKHIDKRIAHFAKANNLPYNKALEVLVGHTLLHIKHSMEGG